MYRTRVDVKGLRTLLHWMYPGTPTFALECGTCTPLDVPRYTYFGIQISEERPLDLDVLDLDVLKAHDTS